MELGILPEEQFEFRYKHTKVQQILRLVEYLRDSSTEYEFKTQHHLPRPRHLIETLIQKLDQMGNPTDSHRRTEAALLQEAELSLQLYSIYCADIPKQNFPMV